MGLDPEKLYKSSNLEVYWKCENGHSWKQKIHTKTDKRALGCIYCDRKTPIITKEPELLKYWDREKNVGLDPHYITCASNKEVYWKCEKGHSWFDSPNDMWKGRKVHCPICEKNVISDEYNLKTEFPETASLYNTVKNKLPVEKIAPYSRSLVYWKCKKGHSWKQIVYRQVKNKGCPYCSHQKTSKKYNLFALYPKLCEEWDYERNNGIDIKKVYPKSGMKAYWKCKNGHSWQAIISDRVENNSHCPQCYKFYQSSFAEQVIYYYMKKIFKDTINRYKDEGYELDIYIPSIKIGIEYDGFFYHQKIDRKKRDKRKKAKDIFFNKKNIFVVHVIERNDNYVDYKSKNEIFCKHDHKYNFMKDVIYKILEIVNYRTGKEMSLDVDVNRDRYAIWDIFLNVKKENSIVVTHPKLVEEWDYEANGSLLPEMFTHGSMQLINWVCQKGHHFASTINCRARYKRVTRCPYCANLKVSEENSLKNKEPELAKEWDEEKNELSPDKVLYRTDKAYYWKCKKGHSWRARVLDRLNGSRCPYCYFNRIDIKKSFSSKEPELLKEWDYDKNIDINPEKIGVTYSKKIWWICKEGHGYKASVQDRVLRGVSCPKCKEILIENELNKRKSIEYIRKQWDEKQNKRNFDENNLKPYQYYFWKCEKGHTWKETWIARKKGRDCPYCNYKKICKDNCFARVYPNLKRKWNKEKNLPLTPYNIMANYSKKVWWQCSKKHEWQRTIKEQLKIGTCPYCSKHIASKEYNFAVFHPEIAKQWDTKLNNGVKVTEVLPKSNLKYYWRCSKGHSWKASPSNRGKGRGCPICYEECRRKRK